MSWFNHVLRSLNLRSRDCSKACLIYSRNYEVLGMRLVCIKLYSAEASLSSYMCSSVIFDWQMSYIYKLSCIARVFNQNMHFCSRRKLVWWDKEALLADNEGEGHPNLPARLWPNYEVVNQNIYVDIRLSGIFLI